DVIPLINRGQPRAIELPEPIASLAGHPRSDLVACIGAETGRVYVVDLDGRQRLRILPPDGDGRIESAALVLGRMTGVLAAPAAAAGRGGRGGWPAPPDGRGGGARAVRRGAEPARGPGPAGAPAEAQDPSPAEARDPLPAEARDPSPAEARDPSPAEARDPLP